MTKKEKRYFEIAKSISQLSKFNRIKIGCIVVLKHEILSTGYNKTKSHPLQKQLNIYRFNELDTCKHRIHAEMDALIKIDPSIDLSNAIIYVYRENKFGIQMSRPCEACMAEIKRRGIKTIYYTTPDGYAKEYIPTA